MGMWTRRRSRLAGSDISSASRGVSIGPGHSALARMFFSGELDRDLPGHRQDPALAGRVGDLGSGRAHQSNERCDVDDRASSGVEHRRYAVLASEEHALEVDAHDPVPGGLRRVGHRAVVGREDPRVVVEDVEPAETLDGESDHGFGVGVGWRRRRENRRPSHPPISFTAAWPASSVTSATTTEAPSRASSVAATFPMPLAAPVIRATFPSRRPMETPSAGRTLRPRPPKGSSGHDSSIEATRGPYRLFCSHTSGLRRVGGWRPSRAAIRFSAASMPMAILVSTVALPR